MSETIIIIDDSRIVTRVLKDILKGEYQVLIAANGQDGIDLARKEKASLVLMGVDMPGEDGYHICGRMKQDPDLKNIPVIFITARESEEDEERGLAVGAIDYLTKPVSPPIVKARVRSHLELKRQRDSLADLSEMKTRLFSILAHDLKNPFTTLLGLTDIMMEMGSELSREEMLDFGRRLNDSSRRVFSLLENLLEWLRLQMGGVAPDLKPVNLAELAHRTLDLMTLPAQEKGVRLISRVPEDLKVMADENMTDTVIRNLAGNALKFTPPQGQVIIESEITGERVVVSVKDSGVGMNADQLARLFQMGKENTTLGTNGEKGTGLGLALCRDLMMRQGSELKVQSAPGQGATFTFALPIIN